MFTSQRLSLIRDAARSLSEIPTIRRVVAPTDLPSLRLTALGQVPIRLIPKEGSISESAVQAYLRRWKALAPNAFPLIKQGGKAAVIRAEMKPDAQSLAALSETRAAASRVVSMLQETDPSFEIHVVGLVALNGAFVDAALGDLMTLFPIMIAVLILGLAALGKGIRGVIAPLAVVLGSVVMAMGIAGHLGFRLTPVLAIAPTVLLGNRGRGQHSRPLPRRQSTRRRFQLRREPSIGPSAAERLAGHSDHSDHDRRVSDLAVERQSPIPGAWCGGRGGLDGRTCPSRRWHCRLSHWPLGVVAGIQIRPCRPRR